MRTSHVPGPSYTHDVFSADFKISGLGQRLGVNIWTFRKFRARCAVRDREGEAIDDI
jgi:hypothetical protein